MTVFVFENGEESQLKNLFLKQTATPPPNLLVFLSACFIPPKSNSPVKTISDDRLLSFEPRFVYQKRQWVRKQAVYTLMQLKDCTKLFPSDL